MQIPQKTEGGITQAFFFFFFSCSEEVQSKRKEYRIRLLCYNPTSTLYKFSMTLGKLFHISKPLFPNLWNGGYNSTYLRGFKNRMHAQHLEEEPNT